MMKVTISILGLREVLEEQVKESKGTEKSRTPVLDNFGRDLTKLAEEDKLDPIIGRDKEIERVAQVLSRRKKNNPILIGEPGVGKDSHCRRVGVENCSKKGLQNSFWQKGCDTGLSIFGCWDQI